jgi:cell wall-associated NlpC family hydrolase
MKKLTIILIVALAFAVWGPTAYADTSEKKSNLQSGYSLFIQKLIENKKAEDLRIKTEQINNIIKINNEKINNKIAELNNYVGKTRYIFSGSTPNGWDCSGLVMWFYSGLDVQLEHSATKQMLSGTLVAEPLPGDIVSFVTSNGQGAYHNGIYIGDGKIIHSPRPGKRTEIREITHLESIEKVRYTRILESGKID